MIKSKQIFGYLRRANPDAMLREGQKLVISAFRNAAKRSPAYKKILSSLNLKPSKVKNLKQFQALVPFLDKPQVCQGLGIQEFCQDGKLVDVRSFLPSSGHGGMFSFGLNTDWELKNSAFLTDLLLDCTLNTKSKKSFLINCLPMGVKVLTSLPLAETSVRQEMVWALVKQFRSKYEQIIIVADPNFLKRVIEDGVNEGIDWKNGVFHFIVGGEGIAENYRSYLAALTKMDFNQPALGMLGASMGVAELGLNIFHETKETILIRRLAHNNPEFKKELFGEKVTACPMFFVYYPQRTYIETLDENASKSEIAISMLNPKLKVPLIRYKTGDLGKLFTYQKVRDTLLRFKQPQLIPEIKLPLIAVYGRNENIESEGRKVYPDEIKEALYIDFQVASSVTGAFKLTSDSNGITLHVQLKKNVSLLEEFSGRIKNDLRVFTNVPINVICYTYSSFPYFMELDYERKFNYI